MREYTIKQDGGYYDTLPCLADASGLAEQLLGAVAEGNETTFTVENEDGYLLAVVTNRRIIGTFNKQEWGGRKGDDAIYIGCEQFDATDAVLLMAHKDLMALEDSDESSDDIGRDHIDWSGPCYVSIVGDICAYFGVGDLEDITPEALADARQRANPATPTEEEITLSVKVTLRVVPGASVSEFIENMNYSLVSNTPGITVGNTEIMGGAQ